MTDQDIVNHLDPDMMMCMITKKWINILDECKWDAASTVKYKAEYLYCLSDCPKFKNHPTQIHNILKMRIPFDSTHNC